MKYEQWTYPLMLLLLAALLAFTGHISASATITPPKQTPLPPTEAASVEEIEQAFSEWAQSAHADTYDNGMGANATCARCKSPTNWDPAQDMAAQEALQCSSCKRIPGAPRPELPLGVAVTQEAWRSITCDICHIPIGDSYTRGIAFWNQALGQYEPVANSNELCTHCHEGRHGFEVSEEQEISPAHQGWMCTRCHGAHGTPVTCSDAGCHDPTIGTGAAEHIRHLQINCTACHDAGQLTVWHDTDPNSTHNNEYIPVRFAHTVTSWPSHNLQLEVDCRRCHHPRTQWIGSVAAATACDACHEDGAVLFWCVPGFLPREQNPNADVIEE